MASEMVERLAAVLANRRAGRRGAPSVKNVLEMLRAAGLQKLVDEVIEDAEALLEEMREPTANMRWHGQRAIGNDLRFVSPQDIFQAMIDAAATQKAKA